MGPGISFCGVYLSPCVYLSLTLIRINTVIAHPANISSNFEHSSAWVINRFAFIGDMSLLWIVVLDYTSNKPKNHNSTSIYFFLTAKYNYTFTPPKIVTTDKSIGLF